MEREKTPVLLLTGYLGSGKTTLLNRILSNEKGIKFAVIVNDIGEVNIDARLIEQNDVVYSQDGSLVPLQNGCICCTLQTDLIKQLSDLIAMKKFDYIVIEASGICEPAPIAQTICSIPQIQDPQTYDADGIPVLDCIVTVVDALRMKDEFGSGMDLLKKNIGDEDIENLVIQQIEFCNIVLLNKAAEVEPGELRRIREIVHALQPKAEIIDCNYGDVPFEKILNTGMFDFMKVATSAAWIEKVEGEYEEEDLDEEEHHHHGEGEAEEYGIGTFVYYRRRPFDLGRFDEFVARKWPKSVIRAKGICYFRNEPDTCYVFEQAGKQVGLRNAGAWYATMPADELETFVMQHPDIMRDWDDEVGDRMQKLVFIGQKMDKKEISRLLDECLF
ncbi:MAG: GTP-binding protein [Bacteroidaceae bacterium]|nr:GTP-binding protein [Bacteroidaceae bacterium]